MLSALIVDDDSYKLSAVEAALIDLGVSSEEITKAQDAAAARRAMHGKKYDLLLLDVLLPARSSSSPSGDVSIDLLRQILEDQTIVAPRHIVGITADNFAIEVHGEEFRSLTTQVLRVDPASDSWKSSLKIIVNLCRASTSPECYNYDVCVLTALRNPEYQAVIDFWPAEWTDEIHLSKGVFFRSGKVDAGGHLVRVACAHSTSMGLVAATDVTGKVLRTLRPRVLLMTGICGGVGSGLSIGDLVVAEKAWDWQSGKYLPGGDFQSSVDQKDAAPDLVSRARQLERSLPTLDSLWRGPRPGSRITLHVAPMVSGSAVLTDARMHDLLRAQHRKVAAVDMEAYGVYFAAHMADAPFPSVLCVKGVSDLADAEKQDWAQTYCSFASAAFALELVKNVFSNKGQ